MGLHDSNNDLNLQKIIQTDDIWSFVEERVVPMLSLSNPWMQYAKVVGAFQLRQSRVVAVPCVEFQSSFPLCYPEYSAGTEDRAPFVGSVTGTVYSWSKSFSEMEPSAVFIRDLHNNPTYGFGGYAANIPVDSATALDILANLKKDTWINEATRAVTINFAAYSSNSDAFVIGQFMFEIAANGYIIATPRVLTVKLETLDRLGDLLPSIIFVIFVAGYLFSEFKEVLSRGLVEYMKLMWNWLEIASLSLHLVVISLFGRFVTDSRQMKQTIRFDRPDEYLEFQHLRITMEQIQDVCAINVLFSSIRVFKFLRLNEKLNLLWTTIALASGDLAAFVAMFVIVFAGYSFMGYIALGNTLSGYHSFSSSFASLISFIGGQFDYDSINNASPKAGVVFFFSFVILVFLIFVNFFIAIIGKYYQEACMQVERKISEQKLGMIDDTEYSILQKLRGKITLVARSDVAVDLDVGWRLKIYVREDVGVRSFAKMQSQATAFGAMASSITVSSADRICECDANARSRVFTRFMAELLREGDIVWIRRRGGTPIKLKIQEVKLGEFVLAEVRSAGQFRGGVHFHVPLSIKMNYFLRKGLPFADRKGHLILKARHITHARMLSAIQERDLIERIYLENKQRHIGDLHESGQFKLEDLLKELRTLADDRNRLHAAVNDRRFQGLLQRAVKLDALLGQLKDLGRPQCSVEAFRDGELLRPVSADVRLKTIWEELKKESINLDHDMGELWSVKLRKEPAIDSLRFDEIVREIRLLLGREQRSGFTEGDIKKEAFMFLFSFPLDCFDPMDPVREAQKYVPRPFNTASIKDTDQDPVLSLGDLVDVLGEVIHDRWSYNKVKDHWVYGKTRDSNQKVHDCLIPYADLTPSEKAYDIKMAAEALRTLAYLGYTIRPPKANDTISDMLSRLVTMDDPRLWMGKVSPGYVLKKVDTSKVQLPNELYELAELLAENNHDVWAKQRKEEGWQYGERQDDNAKTHHLLKPYGLLKDEEKSQDLSTAVETILAVLGLGYSIRPASWRRRWHAFQS